MKGWLMGVTALVLWGAPHSVRGQCAVGSEITVDYDLPGSGYSETGGNWTTWNTSPCNGAGYRYLSHTVGDGSRTGKAIWRPNIPVAGHWRFRTGYRATENRSSDANYFAYGDAGEVVTHTEDQRGDGCTWVDLGVFWCQPGGNCRVELDGTDDGQSDCADVSTFTLVDCDPGAGVGGAPGIGRCDGIRATAAYEVCGESATSCTGVYTDGSGCAAFCAAAGMTCSARYGGEPGCQREPQNPIPCDEVNGHGSDWCECVGPPASGSGGQPGVGGSGGIGATAGAGGAGPGGSGLGAAAGNPAFGGAGTAAGGSDPGAPFGGAPSSAGGTPIATAGQAGAPGTGPFGGASGDPWPGTEAGGSSQVDRGGGAAADDGGCGVAAGRDADPGGWLAAPLLLGLGLRRRVTGTPEAG